MPVYKKGKGKWRIVVFMKGHRNDWVVKGTKKEAQAFEARKRLELESTDPAATRTAPTFFDFCVTRYRPHAEMHLKASTWVRRRYILATLMEYFGRFKMTEITLELVEKYMERRISDGLKPVSVNNELRVLHRILTFAMELGVPHRFPRWKPLRQRTNRTVKLWTEDEVERLLGAIAEDAPDLLPIVVCLANTGLRCGEALALSWADIDLERREIRIETSPEGDWSPKSERWRIVPINDALLPFFNKKHETSEQAVFPCQKTGRRYASWPTKRFDRARKKAGLLGGPHTLRHTFASHFLKKIPDLYLLSRILGHSHTRITELYSHLLPDALLRAREAVNFASPLTPAQLKARNNWGISSSSVMEEAREGVS